MGFYRSELCRKAQLRRNCRTNGTVKRKALTSLQENDNVEDQWLNETAKTVNDSQETILKIRHQDDVIKTPNKKAIGYIGKREQL